MCAGGNEYYDKLLKRPFHFNFNPSYFGEANGANVFFNKDTGEVAIHNLNLKSGLREFAEIFNPNKEMSTCLVKPDGRILFNG